MGTLKDSIKKYFFIKGELQEATQQLVKLNDDIRKHSADAKAEEKKIIDEIDVDSNAQGKKAVMVGGCAYLLSIQRAMGSQPRKLIVEPLEVIE